MNWYEWVFSGIGASVLVLFFEWWRRKRRSPASHKENNAAITAQGAKVSDSPVASGSNISQTVNSPTVSVHVDLANQGVPPTHREEMRQETKARPHIIRGSIGTVGLAPDEDTDIWHISEQGDEGIIVQFANEAHETEANAGAWVKAHLVYRDTDGVERERITGCWLEEAYQAVKFEVDDTHNLILGVLGGASFYGLENRRKEIARYSVDTTKGRLVSNFPAGTVEVRLTNADSGAILYTGKFLVTTPPLKAVPCHPSS